MTSYATHNPKWRRLVELEPRLESLLSEAVSVDGSARTFCANAAWYGDFGWPGMKWRFTRMVGYSRTTQLSDESAERWLHSSGAYDRAYHTIYEALPDCRGCMCF